MQIVESRWHGQEFVSLSGEGSTGTPAEQLEQLLDQAEAALAKLSLTLEAVVLTRFWIRERGPGEDIRSVRSRRLTGLHRSATSTFYSETHFMGPGQVAIDLIALKHPIPESRRLVDFDPPRRYAHYQMHNGWLFASGMAEVAPDPESQFVALFAQLELALNSEGKGWEDVILARIYTEKGFAERTWALDRLLSAIPGEPPEMITAETVSGLASTNKNLEIEIIAK